MYLCILCTPSERDHEPKKEITTNESSYLALTGIAQGRKEREINGETGIAATWGRILGRQAGTSFVSLFP